jgi:Chitobiase/beta-hexosaminidase C-terminal domain/Calx-beta domain
MLSGCTLLLYCQSVAAGERTVIDNERASWYNTPHDPQVGIMINTVKADYGKVSEESIKAPHGYFQHHSEDASHYGDKFPMDQLRAYEAAEVAAGRNPLLVTATYAGKKRNVYSQLSISPDSSGHPKFDPRWWNQAVNLRDDRYIRFFIHNYVRHREWEPWYPNMYMSSDTCIFFYRWSYGVLDDGNVFRPDVRWDLPFAQNDDEFLESIAYFTRRLKDLAPDINLLCNAGQMSDESRFADVWGDFAGYEKEDIMEYYHTDPSSREWVYREFQRAQWLGEIGKISVLRGVLPDQSAPDFETKLRNAYIGYLIFRGENCFFNPFSDVEGYPETPPTLYADMQSLLGRPVAPAVAILEEGAPNTGYRLYSRETEGGIVFWNWTGNTKTIGLPASQKYYDSFGHEVRSITIPDVSGDYVLTDLHPRASFPRINPRVDAATNKFSQYVTVTIDTPTEPAAEIRYTLDGSEPTMSSLLYNGPFRLRSTATVMARALVKGKSPSFVSKAAYTVTTELPTAQFHLTLDSGSQVLGVYCPLISLSHPSGDVVTVRYEVTGGTAKAGVDYVLADGTVTFQPGTTYRYFKMKITNNSAREFNRTVQVSLAAADNAVIAPQKIFTYVISTEGDISP